MSAATNHVGEREFRFDERHFQLLRTLAHDVAGIELKESKRDLVYGRLARRLRVLGLTDFSQYCELVGPEESAERLDFINAITTNVTSFFREPHHFTFLRDEALPDLMSRRSDTQRLRIWSAACSTGQEPYSIAITATGVVPPMSGWDCRILATDIDSNVVARAEAGVYPERQIPESEVMGDAAQWFGPARSQSDEPGAEPQVQVSDAVRRMTYFRVLNLMHPWPMRGPIDVVFCRNVVIYFSKETQRELYQRFHQLLAPDGYLFIGHSESMLHAADLFDPVGRTIYQPKSAGA